LIDNIDCHEQHSPLGIWLHKDLRSRHAIAILCAMSNRRASNMKNWAAARRRSRRIEAKDRPTQGPTLRIGKWVATNDAEWNAVNGLAVGILAGEHMNIEVDELTMRGVAQPVINRGGQVRIKKADINAKAPSRSSRERSKRRQTRHD